MKFVSVALTLAAIVLFIACGQAPTADTNARSSSANNVTTSPATPEAPRDLMAGGRKIYIENCAGCHKEDGRGGKIEIEGKSVDPDDLTSAKIKALPDDKLYGYIYKGIEDEGMPAFKDKLSEAQIREVVRYMRVELQKMPEAGNVNAANPRR
jgi:mono/diheme cytochrome c family protein